ncbi:MAG: aldehyde ferredoxin oxidoreductase family protein [Bacillota bacterium]
MLSGYCGKLLRVDLNTGEVASEPLRSDLGDAYLGGSGIGARLLYEQLGEALSTTDPLGPANPLIFMTGPLSGSTLPSTARMTVNALSPLTGLWGEANVGGTLAAQLKFAGYDGLIITGAAGAPVYLQIDQGKAALLSAADLWGKDTYDTTDTLQERHAAGNRKPAVAAIGPAGENGVIFAAIAHNKGHHFGRTGMGAVMGSKNLKAIIVSGSGKVEPADAAGYSAVRQRLADKMKESMIAQVLNLFGTNCGTDMGHMAGDVPIRNWQQGEWYEGIAALNGPAFDAVLVDRATCYACPVACKRVVEVKEGPFQTAAGPGPEYETIGTFGTMCLIPDAAAVSKINERCNRLGLDTISCGCTIAYAIDLFEKGLITKERTGLPLAWGDAETVLKLVELIAARQGFGEELAAGSARLAELVGGDARRYLATVKKLEIPMHDPRAYHGLGLSYATGIRGACHVSGVTLAVEQGTMLLENIGLEESYAGQSSTAKARMLTLTQDFGMAFSTAGVVCILGGMAYNDLDFADALSVVTGKEWTLEQILLCGRRNWLLKRAVNLLRGASAADDRLPELVLTPLAEGGAAGSVPDMDLMIKEFYALRGIDAEGYPTRESMAEVGLEDVYEALQKKRQG